MLADWLIYKIVFKKEINNGQFQLSYTVVAFLCYPVISFITSNFGQIGVLVDSTIVSLQEVRWSESWLDWGPGLATCPGRAHFPIVFAVAEVC